jgi:nucleotide-binding universal stress UspA family protein
MPYGWSKLFITMGFTYVAFEGFEVISQAGDETIEPRRNLPKAMIYSVFIVTVTYILVSVASLVSVKIGSPHLEDMVPWEWIGSHKEKGFGESVSRLMPFGNFFLTLAVIFASVSALNATIYSATRASYALGRDNMLPPFFSKISRKRKTPWVALMFTGGVVIAVATLLPTMDVASSASIMFLFLFFIVNICVVKIRLNMGDELRYGFIMPWFPWVPIIAVTCQAILAVWLVHMSLIAWIIAPVWIILGITIYHSYSKSRAVTTDDEIQVLEETKITESDNYRVLLAVANPQNALELVRTTYLIGEKKNAQITLLHMVPVPRQVLLNDAEKVMHEGTESIMESMLYLVFKFPITTTIRYCRNIARGIVSAAREKKTDMLIMGWRGKTKSHGFRFGETVDTIIERAPCNVVILKDCGNKQYKRILVPFGSGPNSMFALEIASIMAAGEDSEIVVFSVNIDSENRDFKTEIEAQRNRLQVDSSHITYKNVRANDIVQAIIAESETYDLVVIGATRDPLLHRLAHLSLPNEVARRCSKPLIMAKSSGGLRSWIKRWI